MKRNLLYITLLLISGFPLLNFSQNQVSDSLLFDNTQITPKELNNLREKYKGEEFIYEEGLKATSWWTRFKQWLSDLFMSLFDLKSAGQASTFVDYMINIAGVIITILVIYFIFKAILNKEGKWVFGKSSDKSIIPVISVEENLKDTNFNTLTADAENEDNYRLAIRYYYLWLLKSLANKSIIEYDVEKTNSDYQYEITQIDIAKQFEYTSYLYNYIWYGEFNVNKHDFVKAKAAFTKFLNEI